MVKNTLILLILGIALYNVSCVDLCTPVVPKQPSDCHMMADSNHKCCYYTEIGFKSSCVYLNAHNYVERKNYDCGVGAGTSLSVSNLESLNDIEENSQRNPLNIPLQTCGITKDSLLKSPANSDDCNVASFDTYSCCYVQSQEDNTTGCYLMPFRQNTTFTMSFNGLKNYGVVCSGNYFAVKIFGLILIALLLF